MVISSLCSFLGERCLKCTNKQKKMPLLFQIRKAQHLKWKLKCKPFRHILVCDVWGNGKWYLTKVTFFQVMVGLQKLSTHLKGPKQGTRILCACMSVWIIHGHAPVIARLCFLSSFSSPLIYSVWFLLPVPVWTTLTPNTEERILILLGNVPCMNADMAPSYFIDLKCVRVFLCFRFSFAIVLQNIGHICNNNTQSHVYVPFQILHIDANSFIVHVPLMHSSWNPHNILKMPGQLPIITIRAGTHLYYSRKKKFAST